MILCSRWSSGLGGLWARVSVSWTCSSSELLYLPETREQVGKLALPRGGHPHQCPTLALARRCGGHPCLGAWHPHQGRAEHSCPLGPGLLWSRLLPSLL